MNFSPTVAEMAEMSPICSIIEAMAIGAITRMAVISNLAIEPLKSVKNGWRPMIFAPLMDAKLIRAAPEASFAPHAFAIRAMIYAPTTPSRIGMILIMPLPQMLAAIMMTIETRASHQHVDALSTADEARLSPIRMMMGPVTIGGRNFMTFLTPTSLTISARIRYRRPAITIPPQAYWSFSAAAIVAYFPELSEDTEANPPRKAKEEPRNAGTLNLANKWKRRVPRPAINSVVWIESGSPKLWTRIGTRTVAPNIAKKCWNPSTIILGVPSCLASLIASCFAINCLLSNAKD